MVTQKVVEPGFAPGALTLKSLLYLLGVFPSKYTRCRSFYSVCFFYVSFQAYTFLPDGDLSSVESVFFHSFQKDLFAPCLVHGTINCTVGHKRGGRQGPYSQEVYRQAIKRRQDLYVNYLNPMTFTSFRGRRGYLFHLTHLKEHCSFF